MKTESSIPATIDEYIASFPYEVQVILQSLRQTIHQAAPDAIEIISYQMPAFHLNGNLVYFAAAKKHIGFYPTSSGVSAFQDKLTEYKTSKGAIQFPLDKPLPLTLVKKIVEFRVRENLAKAKPKKKT